MFNFELNSTNDLKREGKTFYWASFFLPKSSKKMQGFFILFVDILMMLLIKIIKIKQTISKIQLRKLRITKEIK